MHRVAAGLILAVVLSSCGRPVPAPARGAEEAAALRPHPPVGVTPGGGRRPSQLAAPGVGVLLAVRAPRAAGDAGAWRAGDAVDVCLAPDTASRRLKVFATYCGRGQDHCAAYVRVPADRALPALAAYDFDRPPTVAAPGGSC